MRNGKRDETNTKQNRNKPQNTSNNIACHRDASISPAWLLPEYGALDKQNRNMMNADVVCSHQL
jgi:hypothetical protein